MHDELPTLECLKCDWEGNQRDLVSIIEDLDNPSYCPKCSSPEIDDIEYI